jgi:hypothetical protein
MVSVENVFEVALSLPQASRILLLKKLAESLENDINKSTENLEDIEPKYNVWGQITTKESIQAAITRMQQLRKEVNLDKNSIREMIEEGRRF